MKIKTKTNEAIEVVSDECYVTGIGGYDGTNAGVSGVSTVVSIINSVYDIIGDVESLINAL